MRQEVIKILLISLGVFFLSALINPLFSHKGATMLFYLPTKNPVTLESIIYGLASAGMITAVLIWFVTLNKIMGIERFLGVIGKHMPHMALLISMIVRFVPKYTRQQKKVKLYAIENKGHKNYIDKLKEEKRVFSITTTWALENSVYTADSMKARGFGCKRRTGYSNYIIEVRDIVVIVWQLALMVAVMIGLCNEQIYTYYYPYIAVKNNIVIYITYGFLCFTPVIINLLEETKWHILKSKI
jgi:energy-coupling factor transport system permease protein